jgi:hypothetical protein
VLLNDGQQAITRKVKQVTRQRSSTGTFNLGKYGGARGVAPRRSGRAEEAEGHRTTRPARCGRLGGRERSNEGNTGDHDDPCVNFLCSAAALRAALLTVLVCLFAQINTINNVVEERKTLKRNNSFTGKLANLNIGKPKSPRMKNKEGKKGLVRSVSFSSFEKEEVTFQQTAEEDDSDLHSSSSDDASVETSTHHDSTLIRSKISSEQQSPTSVCYQDIAEERRTS